MSDINITIRLASKAATAGLDQFGKAAGGASKNLTLFQKVIRQGQRSLDSFYGNLGANLAFRAFNGLTRALGNTITNIREFETALVGVGKTTGLAGDELQALGLRVENLSKEIPVAATELLDLSKTAAQLGVTGTDNILKFSETLSRLAASTDIVGESGAIAFARIINITGDSVENIDRLGSTIVALGNRFATTESQILNVSNEVAKGAARFGLTAEQVLGLSTALSALGVEAQVGGSSLQRIFSDVEQAIGAGGDELKKFTDVLGLSRGEFIELFKTKPQEFFVQLVKGIERTNKEGKDLSVIFAELGFEDKRLTKTLGPLVKNTNLLTRAIGVQNKAYAENIELTQESQAAFDTLDGDLQGLENSWVAFTNSLLRAALPAIRAIVSALTATIDFVAENRIVLDLLIGSFVFGTAVMITFGAGLAKVILTTGALGIALTAATAKAATFWATLGGPITLGVLAITAVVAAIKRLSDQTDEARLANLKAARERRINNGLEVKALDEQIDKLETKIRLDEQNKEIAVGNNTVLRERVKDQADLNEELARELLLRDGLQGIFDKTGAGTVLRGDGSGGISEEEKKRQEDLRKNREKELEDLKNFGEQQNAIKLETLRQSFIQEGNELTLEQEVKLQQEAEKNALELERRQEFLTKKLNQEKEFEKLTIENEKKRNARELAALKRSNDAKLKVARTLEDQKANIQAAGFQLGAALAKDGSKTQFIIQKAAALAEIALARGKSLALVPAMVAPIIDPTPSQSIRLAAAAKLTSGINLQAALGAATVLASAIKGFQDGGIVGGNSFSGDNVLARVNSGEMILNREQQAQLFEQANGQGPTNGGGDIVVQIDGEEVFRAVSRKVAEGRELGEGGV